MAIWKTVVGKHWVNLTSERNQGGWETFSKPYLFRDGTEEWITLTETTSCFHFHKIQAGTRVLSLGDQGVACQQHVSLVHTESNFLEQMRIVVILRI